jgi:hypothetical protein
VSENSLGLKLWFFQPFSSSDLTLVPKFLSFQLQVKHISGVCQNCKWGSLIYKLNSKSAPTLHPPHSVCIRAFPEFDGPHPHPSWTQILQRRNLSPFHYVYATSLQPVSWSRLPRSSACHSPLCVAYFRLLCYGIRGQSTYPASNVTL